MGVENTLKPRGKCIERERERREDLGEETKREGGEGIGG